MVGNLVIVESPAKAKTIQKFLGSDYTVKPSFGHIRDLDEKKLGIDIEDNFRPEYMVPADKKKVVADLKKTASQVQTVWLASDEDREGEAISWHLAETLGLDMSKTKRIVFHEITRDAILNAIESPREIDMNLVYAQQARRVLDRLVGFELSPILWRKIQPRLSAGRVQSVALRLVVEREKEIMSFENEPFYKVEALFRTDGEGSADIKAVLDRKFTDISEAETFLEDCIGAVFTVSSVEPRKGSRIPAPPFTTSTLQQEAARKLHFPVNVTMRVAQSLYERGLITYMRTDSTNLSSLALGTSKKYIIGTFGEEYSHPRQFKTHSKGAQEAHEAIRPTFVENTAIEGTAQEQKLYSLIWKRTIASQMEDASVINTTIKVDCNKREEKFTLQATRILFDGFLKLYMEGSDDETTADEDVILPEIKVGDTLRQSFINAECKFTQAPFRYSEATLVKKLEELGIGRPSTYAPIITTLTTGRGYLMKGDKDGRKVAVTNLCLKGGSISRSQKTEVIGAERGKLFPQEIGMIVSDYLLKNFPDIVNYDFTANVEKDFDKIAEGGLPWEDVISSFYSPFHKIVEDTLSNGEFSHVSKEIGIAPDGELLVARFGKYGAYIQKGPAEKKQFANLNKGQLIDNLTVEDVLKLFALPRTVGQMQGNDIILLKGKFGPYIKFGDRNIPLPRGKDALTVTDSECIEIITAFLSQPPANTPLQEFEGGISVLSGKFGPYIKFNGLNYKIPKGQDPQKLSKEDCLSIINNTKPANKSKRTYKK